MSGKKVNLQLTKQEIENVEFLVSVKGYKAEEVDAFLDKICEDYERVQSILKEKNDKIDKLEYDIQNLQSELQKESDNNIRLTKALRDLQNISMSNADMIKAANAKASKISLSEAINKSK